MITPSYRNIYGRYTRNTGRSIWPWAELYQDIMKYRGQPKLATGTNSGMSPFIVHCCHFEFLHILVMENSVLK